MGRSRSIVLMAAALLVGSVAMAAGCAPSATKQAANPLKDPRVRAAISLAINRDVMVKTIYEGTRKPATGLVPPGVVGFLPDQGKYCKYDPAQAKSLLAKAGYPNGTGLPTFDLSFNSGAGHEPVMQQVQANLADIGINVKLDGMEWAQFIKFRQAGKHQIARDGWIFDYPIMDNMLYPLFFSKNIGKDNTSRYANPTFDKLVLEARQTGDKAARLKLYQQAERTVLDDAGAVPLNFYAHRAVAQKWVKGLVYSPLGLVNSNMVSFASTPAKTDKMLNFYINEPAYIDPYNAQESEGVQVVNDVFDSLVDFDPITSDIKPAAAETWTASNNFTVWTFKLDPKDTFQNGRQVTADDFVYAWNRIANPADKTIPAPSDVSYHLAPVVGFDKSQESTHAPVPLAGVKALDKLTLQVTLSYPFADFQYVVGHPALAPVPKEVVEKNPKAFADKPVGNGPFMMAGPWVHNQQIALKRFDGYYGTKATLDGVNYKIFKDEETAFLEFKAGKLDFTKSIPTGQIKPTVAQFGQSSDGYTASPGADVLIGAETATYYLNINNGNDLPASTP